MSTTNDAVKHTTAADAVKHTTAADAVKHSGTGDEAVKHSGTGDEAVKHSGTGDEAVKHVPGAYGQRFLLVEADAQRMAHLSAEVSARLDEMAQIFARTTGAALEGMSSQYVPETSTALADVSHVEIVCGPEGCGCYVTLSDGTGASTRAAADPTSTPAVDETRGSTHHVPQHSRTDRADSRRGLRPHGRRDRPDELERQRSGVGRIASWGKWPGRGYGPSQPTENQRC